jgi:two-component system CheB/CheR fusion protein
MVLCKDYALPYFDDHIDGLVITFTDITWQKKAEEALNYENRYLRLFESATDGILSMPKLEKLLM